MKTVFKTLSASLLTGAASGVLVGRRFPPSPVLYGSIGLGHGLLNMYTLTRPEIFGPAYFLMISFPFTTGFGTGLIATHLARIGPKRSVNYFMSKGESLFRWRWK